MIKKTVVLLAILALMSSALIASCSHTVNSANEANVQKLSNSEQITSYSRQALEQKLADGRMAVKAAVMEAGNAFLEVNGRYPNSLDELYDSRLFPIRFFNPVNGLPFVSAEAGGNVVPGNGIAFRRLPGDFDRLMIWFNYTDYPIDFNLDRTEYGKGWVGPYPDDCYHPDGKIDTGKVDHCVASREAWHLKNEESSLTALFVKGSLTSEQYSAHVSSVFSQLLGKLVWLNRTCRGEYGRFPQSPEDLKEIGVHISGEWFDDPNTAPGEFRVHFLPDTGADEFHADTENFRWGDQVVLWSPETQSDEVTIAAGWLSQENLGPDAIKSRFFEQKLSIE